VQLSAEKCKTELVVITIQGHSSSTHLKSVETRRGAIIVITLVLSLKILKILLQPQRWKSPFLTSSMLFLF